MIRTSSAAEIHKPLQPQSKAPDVYSRMRECACDCKCNAIYFNQTCHMNSLGLQNHSGCLPLVSKSSLCCSETQNMCLTSCYWVAKTQWRLASEGRKLGFSKCIQQHRQEDWLLPLAWCLWEMIHRVKVLSLLGDKKRDCFHVETCGNTSDHRWSEHLVRLLKYTNHCSHRVKRQMSIPRKESVCAIASVILSISIKRVTWICFATNVLGASLQCPKVAFAAQRLRTRALYLATE